MNTFQQKLWDDLMALVVETDSPFYFKDFENPSCHVTKAYYRIFNYRLASYTDFLKPSALECRGVMFEIDEKGNPCSLACLPMSKFFNLNENPHVMNLDLSSENIAAINTKMDGSLISTFWGDLAEAMGVKSKGSLDSSQVQDAQKLLSQDASRFLWELGAITEDGYTVNMEYVAPSNRIVIGYPKPDLVVLSVRCRKTGVIFFKDWNYLDNYPTIRERWVKYHTIIDSGFVADDVAKEEGIEGYVVRLKDGTTFKVKTQQYVTLHKLLSNISAPKGLYEAIVLESIDDILPFFAHDLVLTENVHAEQKRISNIYNMTVNTIENFWTQNSHLDRKSYAIKGQQELPRHLFGCVMQLYLGNQLDYRQILLKNYELFQSDQQKMQEVPLGEG